jgi:hypothetical protein
MHGKDYVAVRRISNLADHTLADVGDTCERIPSAFLQGHLDAGDIMPVTPGVAPARGDDDGDAE